MSLGILKSFLLKTVRVRTLLQMAEFDSPDTKMSMEARSTFLWSLIDHFKFSHLNFNVWLMTGSLEQQTASGLGVGVASS